MSKLMQHNGCKQQQDKTDTAEYRQQGAPRLPVDEAQPQNQDEKSYMNINIDAGYTRYFPRPFHGVACCVGNFSKSLCKVGSA